MKEEAASESALRQFLLGNVDEEERERLESLFVTDSVARERILAAEQDLIDDYLDGSLSSAEKQRFIERYADTPTQKRTLRIARTIKDWATAQGNVSRPVVPERRSLWNRLRDGIWLKPSVAIPIAASAMIAIIAVSLWLNSRIERRNQQLAIQEEVVHLNDPNRLREVPQKMSSLELRPGSLRSTDAQNELVIGPDTEVAELRLLWIRKEQYPRYRAILKRVGGNDSVTISDLQAENDGRVIRLRLPDQLFTRGNYKVELIGIQANGTNGDSDEYHFNVRS